MTGRLTIQHFKSEQERRAKLQIEMRDRCIALLTSAANATEAASKPRSLLYSYDVVAGFRTLARAMAQIEPQ